MVDTNCIRILLKQCKNTKQFQINQSNWLDWEEFNDSRNSFDLHESGL